MSDIDNLDYDYSSDTSSLAFDFSLAMLPVLEQKFDAATSNRFLRWWMRASQYIPSLNRREYMASAKDALSQWLKEDVHNRGDGSALRSRALARLDESRRDTRDFGHGKRLTMQEVHALIDARGKVSAWDYAVADNADGSLAVSIENGVTLRIDATFLPTLARLHPWSWRNGRPVKLVKKFHKSGGTTVLEEPCVTHVLAAKLGSVSDWDMRRSVKFVDGDRWNWTAANSGTRLRTRFKEQDRGTGELHPTPMDVNDKHQNMMVECFQNGGELPETAELKPEDIFRGRKLFDQGGMVTNDPDLVQTVDLTPANDREYGKPASVPPDAGDVDYEEKKSAPELRTENLEGLKIKQVRRTTKVWCPQCGAMRRLRSMSEKEMFLECRHTKIVG